MNILDMVPVLVIVILVSAILCCIMEVCYEEMQSPVTKELRKQRKEQKRNRKLLKEINRD